MTDPLVTVLLPTIGRMAFFPAALEAVRQQTWTNLEILVGDNASTDGTADYTRSIAAQDARVRTYHEAERSMPVNWQHGVEEARGDFLTIVSDDDLPHPDFVRKCVEAFAVHPTAESVLCLFEVIDEHGRTDHPLTQHHQTCLRRLGEGLVHLHVGTHDLGTGMMCALLRMEQARRIGFRREAGLAADSDYFWRAGVGDGFEAVILPEVLIQYRVHSGSFSAGPVRQTKDAHLAQTRLEREHPEIVDLPAWREKRSQTIGQLIHWLIRNGEREEARHWLRAEASRLTARQKVLFAIKLRANALGLYPKLGPGGKP